LSFQDVQSAFIQIYPQHCLCSYILDFCMLGAPDVRCSKLTSN